LIWQFSTILGIGGVKDDARTLLPQPDKRQLNRPHILCFTNHQSGSVFPVTFYNIVNHSSCF